MTEAGQYWTLRFHDPSLERAYQADIAKRSRQHYRMVVGVCLVMWVLVLPFDNRVGGNAQNAYVLSILKLLVEPFIAVAFIVSLLREQLFARSWRVAWAAASIAALTSVILLIPSAPYPTANWDEYHAAGFILVLIVVITAVPIRAVHIGLIGGVACTAMIGVLTVYTDIAFVFSPLIVTGFVIPMTSIIGAEQSRRRVFLLARLLDAEREKSDALLHR